MDVFDKDGDGKLTTHDLRILLGMEQQTKEEKQRVKERAKRNRMNMEAAEKLLEMEALAAAAEDVEETEELRQAETAYEQLVDTNQTQTRGWAEYPVHSSSRSRGSPMPMAPCFSPEASFCGLPGPNDTTTFPLASRLARSRVPPGLRRDLSFGSVTTPTTSFNENVHPPQARYVPLVILLLEGGGVKYSRSLEAGAWLNH